jgi:hypothetical protein
VVCATISIDCHSCFAACFLVSHVNVKKSNSKGENQVPVRRMEDESNRRHLLEAIDFPNPCVDLPANRAGWTLALPPTDDGSSDAVPLSFSFKMYGQSYNSVIINNNGPVSFTGPFTSWVPAGFPLNNGVPMVAPFWSDIWTVNAGQGSVWRRTIGSNKFAVIWDHVDNFARNTDLRNTFQVIISDGTDASMGYGNNVCFCYEDMQWADSTGFGGAYPSNVGINNGDGVNFYQIGRFGQPGSAYDGPYGNNDGIDYLDRKSFCFQTVCQITAEIWDPDTDTVVGPLISGNTYCLNKYNLRGITCDNTPPVDLKLWNTDTGKTLKRQTENVEPFFLWGDIVDATTGNPDVNPNPKPLANGNYALRVTATNLNVYTDIRFTQSCP